MQVGVDGASASQSTVGNNANINAGTNHSIGQRIKESATLKDQYQNGQSGINNNVNNNSTTHANSNGSSNNYANGRTSRTAPVLYQASNSNDKQLRRQTEPVVLSNVQRNTIRVIGQYLRDLGMNDTVDSLVEESGCRIENSLASCLQDYVLMGAWSQALDVVEKFKSSLSERRYITIRVLLLEERFKKLVTNNEYLAALHLLQFDYPKVTEFKDRCDHLAITLNKLPILTSESCESGDFFVYKTANSESISQQHGAVDSAAGFRINNEAVLKTLHKMLPPTFLLPPNRLNELFKQSWLYQVSGCELHLSSAEKEIDDKAILKNHQCTVHDFPSKKTQVLYDHHAEVWCLEFSPCGKYLASGGKSNAVLIWRVDESTQLLSLMNRFQIPADITGIAFVSWSTDSQYLAVASSEENTTGVFVYNIQRGILHAHIQPTASDSYSVVSFFKDGSHRLACGDQRGHFHVFDINQWNAGSPKSFEGFRIRCIYSMKNGKTVLAADTHNRIRSYDFENNNETTVIQETSQIMYFTVDSSERYCLITTKTEGIKLWSLKTKILVKSFYGSSHHEFVISSSFGGFNNNFIASGSEDENILIWNISKSEPVTCLTGHTGTVNAVSWNPVLHGLLASASDDFTIHVWSSRKVQPC